MGQRGGGGGTIPLTITCATSGTHDERCYLTPLEWRATHSA